MLTNRLFIRGTGLLAWRLMTALLKNSMQVSGTIAKADPTLARLIESRAYGGFLAKVAVPEHFFLDEKPDVVKKLRGQYPHIRFSPLEEMVLEGACDALIDTAPMTSNRMGKEFRNFSGPIICQDGVYPWGHLIAPPLLTTSIREKRFRQGGCILSGLAPVFSALGDIVKKAGLNIIMQDDSRGDYFIAERTNIFRFIETGRVNAELEQLFGGNIVLKNVLQIPGMMNYAVIAEMACLHGTTAEDITGILSHSPRVRVVPKGVNSTHDLNLIRSTDLAGVPPIAVFAESIQVTDTLQDTLVKMIVGLHYPMLAVLPNVDAIRILLDELDPVEAMRKTDEAMNF